MNERNRQLFTGRTRRGARIRIILGFVLLIAVCAYACAAPRIKAAPFTDTLNNVSHTASSITGNATHS